MGAKFHRQSHAVGHWSSPHKRTNKGQVASIVRVLLQDKLITRGEPVYLYLPVSSRTPGAVACGCTKATTSQADRGCLSCMGTQYAPGYLKFLHETQFWCSAESADFDLTAVELSTTKKANVLMLDTGELTGTIVTQAKDITPATTGVWGIRLDAYLRAEDSTVELEYSVDDGDTYSPVTLTAVEDGFGFDGEIQCEDIVETSIQFRITLTRANADDLPPAFEILRMRRPLVENRNKQLRRVRPDMPDGSILMLMPWVQEQDSLEPGRGRIVDHVADKAWTCPLDFFDRTIVHDTRAARVEDEIGPHPFYEFIDGVTLEPPGADTQPGVHVENERYALVKVYYSDRLGLLTQQYFDDREVQPGEAISLVW